PDPYPHPPEHSAYSGVGGHSGRVIAVIAGVMGSDRSDRSDRYVQVFLQITDLLRTLKYLEKIISISFSHLLNTNTSPASNSSLIASFRLSRDSSSSSLSRDHLPDSSTFHPLLV
ncbi:hypothetical protein L249_8345, partial [Ophiocordyceps polyrhachis-furcata BCC 54312]